MVVTAEKLKTHSDDEIVREILNARRKDFPKEIDSFAVSLSKDHAGEPAIYIVFEVKGTQSPSKAKVTQFRQFSESLEQEILTKGLEHWPYIRFAERVSAK
jgi:hypothetical protein